MGESPKKVHTILISKVSQFLARKNTHAFLLVLIQRRTVVDSKTHFCYAWLTLEHTQKLGFVLR